jgi:hypothetical protein
VVPIRARAAAAAPPGVTTGAPYQVPANFIDKYICFDFDLGLPGPSHALQFKAHVADPAYVHHWLLYKKKAGVGAFSGFNDECLGLHADSELIAGWAPGTLDWNLPGHVGMDLGEGKFILEIHYNNTGGPRQDDSGVDVCVTQNLRRETAGLHWLGTESISIPPQQARDAADMCRPANQAAPIHVLRWWPHMHLLGTHMKIDLYRGGAFSERVLDEPFDFYNQIQYDRPRVIQPGDSILTTCSFFNTTPSTVTFGTSTSAEMCYNFVVAYPQNALVSQPRGLHENSCQGRP